MKFQKGIAHFLDVLFSHTASDIFTMLYTNEYVGADGVTYDASMKKLGNPIKIVFHWVMAPLLLLLLEPALSQPLPLVLCHMIRK